MTRSALAQELDDRVLLTSELDSGGLVFTLVGIHRIVVLPQQRLDPSAVQINRTRTRLFGKCLIHDRCQPCVAFAAEPLADIDQALLQTLGKCSETFVAELGGLVKLLSSVWCENYNLSLPLHCHRHRYAFEYIASQSKTVL